MCALPAEGEIYWEGQLIRVRVEEYRRSVGFLSHTSFLYADLTTRENLEFFGKLFA